MTTKILVIGDINGQYEQVFSKINKLHEKNAFALCIVAGNLFGDGAADEDLIQGKVRIDVPTYFCLGKIRPPDSIIQKLQQSDGELCDNLQFVGRSSTIKTTDGIRLVSLGGSFSTDPFKRTDYTPLFSADDVKALNSDKAAASHTDILITTQWPSALGHSADANSASDRILSDLIMKLKPKYHFCASSSYSERPPFFHPLESDGSSGYAITRFLTLAPFGNADKQKWIYAFGLEPGSNRPHALPSGCQPSPLKANSLKRPAETQLYQRFSNDVDDGRPRRRRKGNAELSCFFCMDNQAFKPHLVTSIGSNAYMTVPKGPLTRPDTFNQIGFSAHILIIPLAHVATIGSIADAEERQATLKEMQQYRTALHDMLDQLSSKQLGSVTWEVSKSSGVHTHWQFCPIPADLITRGIVEAAFKVQAENDGYGTFDEGSDDEADMGDCFKVMLWTPDGTARQLSLPLDASFRFDMQFGRRVLANLLEIPGRAHWKQCVQSDDEEEAEAVTFKGAFEPFEKKYGFDVI